MFFLQAPSCYAVKQSTVQGFRQAHILIWSRLILTRSVKYIKFSMRHFSPPCPQGFNSPLLICNCQCTQYLFSVPPQIGLQTHGNGLTSYLAHRIVQRFEVLSLFRKSSFFLKPSLNINQSTGEITMAHISCADGSWKGGVGKPPRVSA